MFQQQYPFIVVRCNVIVKRFLTQGCEIVHRSHPLLQLIIIIKKSNYSVDCHTDTEICLKYSKKCLELFECRHYYVLIRHKRV